MAARKLALPQRGEVYLVSFDPIGAEIQKTRSALVLQNDVSNEYSPITIVAAITSKFDELTSCTWKYGCQNHNYV
jgi:mRNA interferase MazF